MDLPTCPSCGQSVLDDDATDCPFCGAAMDGSAPAKKSKKKSKTPGGKSKQQADSDDPFSIEQAPTAKNVIPCARKPSRGRMQRVVCPMCDAQGFIPKAALGRQVKCANKGCLVPVFTATEGDPKEQAKRAPSRVSDDTVASETKVQKPASAKNPMLIYGIVVGVLVAATAGLVFYLNSVGVDKLSGVEVKTGNYEDDPDSETVVTQQPTTEKLPEYRKRALDLVNTMISDSRVSAGNRDKSFCRRLTGDIFLRLGMADEATAEFEQMDKVAASASRRIKYFRIGPLIAQYWRAVANDNSQLAGQTLAKAKDLANTIPKSGDTALESGILLAAALVNAGEVSEAKALISPFQPDETVSSQMDTIRLAGWSATSVVLHDQDRISTSPLQAFAWKRPLKTAVAAQLAVRGRWEAAIKWAAAAVDASEASDTFATIAEQMVQQAATASADALVAAAKEKGADVALRTESVLARSAAAQWASASQSVEALPAVEPATLGGIEALIGAKRLDIDAATLRANAIADYVVAATKQGESEKASAALDRLFQEVSSVVVETSTIRAAARELEKDENKVKQRIEKELRITSPNKLRSKFIAYRNGVGYLLRAAEARRSNLIYMLARIIENGGLEAVRTALASNSNNLQQEVGVGRLNGLLFVAAAASDQEFTEMQTVDDNLAVGLYRADLAEEAVIMDSLIKAWNGYLKNDFSAVVQLESQDKLPGLRAATVRFISEKMALKAKTAKDQIDAAVLIRNSLWREQCLAVSTRTLTRRGMIKDIVPALNDSVKSPSQRVAAFYGIALGALDMESAKSGADEAKAAKTE